MAEIEIGIFQRGCLSRRVDCMGTLRRRINALELERNRARRILRRVEFHYTPKHGSWLNMAEIEIGIFQRGCLSRRVDCLGTLRRRINALEMERNRAHRTISWQFTCQDARSKLAHLYPEIKQVKAYLA